MFCLHIYIPNMVTIKGLKHTVFENECNYSENIHPRGGGGHETQCKHSVNRETYSFILSRKVRLFFES